MARHLQTARGVRDLTVEAGLCESRAFYRHFGKEHDLVRLPSSYQQDPDGAGAAVCGSQ